MGGTLATEGGVEASILGEMTHAASLNFFLGGGEVANRSTGLYLFTTWHAH